ncbi:unnamed protein product [Darwinula stevensoni]|uniref:Kringle domain-containing protein n=1 Tax=Darwinula stevensoni TaxID=69355 RepID=A0A7R9ADJ8_9CRUS|nr:unnamed protein product [Darwinula stevensoni]CAG0901178.1 unnamed protein product [Darwinula stevensoni]
MGAEYRGRKNVTITGKPCLPWADNPNGLDLTSFPASIDLDAHRNFFRNLDFEWSKSHCQFGHWCYVDDGGNTTWEYCDIRFCESRVDFEAKGNKYPECRLSEKGIEYVGSQNTTEIGHDCLKLGAGYRYYREHYDRPWCFVSDPKTVWEYCEIPFCHDPHPPECKLSRHGMEYMGKLDVTISGYPCKSWLRMVGPNQVYHALVQFVFSDECDSSHRFCRNYDENRHGLWCYSDSDNGPEWEYCDVPFCSSANGRPCDIKIAGKCVSEYFS